MVSAVAMSRFQFLGWRGMISLASILILVLLTALPTSSSVRALPPDEVCERQLERIGKAIATYRMEKGHLPESVVEKGTGLKHSWRALIAPYLMEQTRFRRDEFKYSFDEPWDSTRNKEELLDAPLASYTCPVESRVVDHPYATYLMLTRDGSEKAGDGKQGTDSLPEDAVFIVESSDCRIEIGKPRDLDMETLFKGDCPFGIGKLNSYHPNVVRAIRVDGKVIDIPKSISKEKLRKLLMGTPRTASFWERRRGTILVVVGIVGTTLLFVLFVLAHLRHRNVGENQGVEENLR